MGLSKIQIEGKSCFELYSKEQADAFWKDDLEVINSKKPKRNIIEPMKSPSGTHFWVRRDKIPFKDDDDNIIGVIGFTVGITAQKLAEDELIKHREQIEQLVKERTAELEGEIKKRIREEEERRTAALYARSLIEANLDPLVTISSEGKIMDVNHATEQATGCLVRNSSATNLRITLPSQSKHGAQHEKPQPLKRRWFCDTVYAIGTCLYDLTTRKLI